MWHLAEGDASVQADHTGDLYDCELQFFSNQAAAQAHYREHPSDQDNLDGDNDRIACNGTDLPCPCDFTPVPPPDDDDTDSGSDVDDDPPPDNNNGGGGGSGPLSFSGDDDDSDPADDCAKYYNQPFPNQADSDIYPYGVYGCLVPQHPILIPGPSRTAHISMVFADTSVECNEETALVARLLLPTGVGASAHLIQFQSTLGTVFSNVLTDPGGYAQTRFVAPSMPAQVQITAYGDGLVTTQTVNVTCKVPAHMHPPVDSATPPAFKPPSTGEAGLVQPTGGGSWVSLAVVALLAFPAGLLVGTRAR